MHKTRKSAAEITKGDMKVITLSETDVERAIDPAALLKALAGGFRDLSNGLVQSPPRPEITVPGKGFMLAMPAWREGMPMMVKTVCVFEGNLDLDLPNHLALITLYAPETGMPVCVMDGTYITGVRTAGAAVVSVDALARADAKVATIIGAGVQGREHLRLLPQVRDFEKINVCSLIPEDAEVLAAMNDRAVAHQDVEAAVRESDVVCLASHSYTPVVEAAWVQPGTHLSSVGYAPPDGELPRALAEQHTLIVEGKMAFEEPPVGCGELRGLHPARAMDLGDILTGKAGWTRTDGEITVYKAMGIAMEDLVAANIAYETATSDNQGGRMVL